MTRSSSFSGEIRPMQTKPGSRAVHGTSGKSAVTGGYAVRGTMP